MIHEIDNRSHRVFEEGIARQICGAGDATAMLHSPDIFAAFDRLCSMGTLVPAELNLFRGEVAWAERHGMVDPLAVAIDHARLGMLRASAADVQRGVELIQSAELDLGVMRARLAPEGGTRC